MISQPFSASKSWLNRDSKQHPSIAFFPSVEMEHNTYPKLLVNS